MEQSAIAAVSPADFARSIATSDDAQLATVMAGDFRAVILDEVMRRMSEYFRADRAVGIDAVIHWKIYDRPGGSYDHYEVVIRAGACAVSKQPRHRPRVTFGIGPVDFLRLVTGNASGPRLALRGRLRIRGDLLFARTVARLFRIPRAPDQRRGEVSAAA